MSHSQQPELRIKPQKVDQRERQRIFSAERQKMNKLNCLGHQFCAINYDFGMNRDPTQKIDEDKQQLDLSISYQKQFPEKFFKSDPLEFNQITEQSLDDWIMKSINRPIEQVLDIKKQFGLPQEYLEELRQRYANLRSAKMQMENREYYYNDHYEKQQKFIIQNGKSLLNPQNRLFESKKLIPEYKEGVPIKVREELKLKQKSPNFRRKAIYFQLEEGYKKLFLEQQQRERERQSTQIKFTEKKVQIEDNEEEHFFIQNADNITRYIDNREEVLTSHAQHEMDEVKSKLAQMKVNQQEVWPPSNKNNQDIKYYLSNQRIGFQKQIQSIVTDFKTSIKQKQERPQTSMRPPSRSLQTQFVQKNANTSMSFSRKSNWSRNQQRSTKYGDTTQIESEKDDNRARSQAQSRKSTQMRQSMQRHMKISEQVNYLYDTEIDDSSKQQLSQKSNNQIISRELIDTDFRKQSIFEDLQEQKRNTIDSRQTPSRNRSKEERLKKSGFTDSKFRNSIKEKDEYREFKNEIEQKFNEHRNWRDRRDRSVKKDRSVDKTTYKQIINQDRNQPLDLIEEAKNVNLQLAVRTKDIKCETSMDSRLSRSYNKYGLETQKITNVLSQKTQQLLNHNSEERIKYQWELSCFNANLKRKTELYNRQDLTDGEFWFNKAVMQLHEDKETALHCFKQCLFHEPSNLRAIQNVAVLYEQLGKYKTSKNWFQLGLEFKTQMFNKQTDCDIDDLKFGYALCLYKMGLFSQSYYILDQMNLPSSKDGIKKNNQIKDVIEDIMPSSKGSKDQQKRKNDNQTQYIYLKGLCAKRMYELEKAAQNYKIFQEKTVATNYELFVHFMMAVLFSQKRQLEIKFDPFIYCQFHSLVSEVIDQEIYVEQLTQFWSKQQNNWIKEEELVIKLKNAPFFKRFAISVLRKFIPVMKFKTIQQGNIIFPKSNEVQIIAAGNVLVLDHRDNFDRPDIIAFYKQGDIIGCPEKDNQLCEISDIWFLAQTQIEYISIQRNYFNDLWEAQIRVDGFAIHTILKKLKIFQGISILTQYKLVYELLQLQKPKRNTVLFNDSSYIEKFDYIHLRKPQKFGNNYKFKINFLTCLLTRSNLKNLLSKHKIEIDRLKFNRQFINGFFLILQGQCEIENPFGLNNYFLDSGCYFGESLMFSCAGFNNYGRIRVSSDDCQILHLSRFNFNKIPSLDLKIMEQNCKERPELKYIDVLQKKIISKRNKKTNIN